MTTTSNDFNTEVGAISPGFNFVQRVGRRAWPVMLAMAVMAFPVAAILGGVRADAIATGSSETTISSLGHVATGFNFIGFGSVFAAITFAIARILGEFRKGGGDIQQAAGDHVKTLVMPATAKLMVGLMMMAQMAVLAAVVLHFVVAAAIASGSSFALAHAEQWTWWLEAGRRGSVAVYLLAITLGLATIVTVLRFQAIRILELVPARSERAST